MSSTVTTTAAKTDASQSKGKAASSNNAAVRRTRRPPQQVSRAYDHLYDPVYNVSGQTVHNRHLAQSMYSRTVVVPNDQNLFSDVQHYPRMHLELDRNDPVPPSMPRDHNTLTRQYAQQQQRDIQASDIRGRDLLLKYVQRPNMVAQTDNPNVRLTAFDQRVNPLVATTAAAQRADIGAFSNAASTRTVGTQSDYRESETQTDPWTSEYFVRPGSAPEVLTLQSLSHGHGLPAGLNEVIMIERARAKRAWEKTLPDISDESQIKERIRMMEEQEAREWQWRQEEIEQIQQRRIDLVAQLIEERAQDQEIDRTQKLETVLARRHEERSENQQRVQQSSLRELRRLQQLRTQVEKKPHDRGTRGAVAKYTSPASSAYAAKMREGTLLIDAAPERHEVHSDLKDTFDGLLELEGSLPESITAPRIRLPPRNPTLHGGQQHRDSRYQDRLDTILNKLKTSTENKKPTLRFLRRIPPDPVRGPVRSVEMPDADHEKKKQSVLLLQRLLRGRAEQAAMFQGKSLRRNLVSELRSTHALQKAEQEIKASEKQHVIDTRDTLAQRQQVHAARESAVHEVAATHAGQTLDFLSKELIRLQEERRIHAFSMLAERQRRIREAEETGRREREERRRSQTDEIFRQIVGVHQDCVDSYLEDILMDSRETVAEDTARAEIREKAAAIDRVAHDLLESGIDATQDGAMSISAELVSTFLLPEAEKLAKRSVIKNKQRRFQVAAHKELITGMTDVEASVGSSMDTSNANNDDDNDMKPVAPE
eukprot:m.86132 g.86132  ORF g.86132 m.86132 type:complete len:767 (+) comp25930_c0_seq2:221-2521(+)